MKRFLNKLYSNQVVKKMNLLEYNKISFILIKNPKNPKQTKHINIIYYYI